MTRARAINKATPHHCFPVRDAAKKAAVVSVLFPLLASGVSYAAYTDDLGTSDWPWKIGVTVMLVSLAVLRLLVVRFGTSQRLWVLGVAQSIGLFAVYFFFGVFAYFYLFVFAPLPPQIKWPGFVGGLLITSYWFYASGRSVLHTIEHTSFQQRGFDEQPEAFRYRVQAGMTLFDRLNKEKSPFPKVLAFVVAGLAPCYLMLERLLSSQLGTSGVLFFLAVLGMPVSLWFGGVLVRVCLVMIALPRRLEREHGKPVIVDDR